jgi:hypothetical protein
MHNILMYFESHVSEIAFFGQLIWNFVGNRLVKAHIHGKAQATGTGILGSRCFLRGTTVTVYVWDCPRISSRILREMKEIEEFLREEKRFREIDIFPRVLEAAEEVAQCTVNCDLWCVAVVPETGIVTEYYRRQINPVRNPNPTSLLVTLLPTRYVTISR